MERLVIVTNQRVDEIIKDVHLVGLIQKINEIVDWINRQEEERLRRDIRREIKDE